MPLDPQGTVYLTDAQGRSLGQVFIERIEGDRVFGRIAPHADFAAVRALFEELEAAYWDLASGNCLTSSGASSLTLRSA